MTLIIEYKITDINAVMNTIARDRVFAAANYFLCSDGASLLMIH